MFLFNRLTAALAIVALLGPMFPAEAHTRKGDHLLAEGRAHETRKEYDAALDCYERALAEDPSDVSYQMAVDKARFRASQAHLDIGIRTRAAGQLGNALLEFQKAYATDPGSAVAAQEIRTTQEMIARERKRLPNAASLPPKPSSRMSRRRLGGCWRCPSSNPSIRRPSI